MEQSNSMEDLHIFSMSTGNVRNLARLFEDNSVPKKPNYVLTRSKSKSFANVTTRTEVKETFEKETLTFRDIHSKFESGATTNKPMRRAPSVNSLECLKLQEIKEIGRKTDEIIKKVKDTNKTGSTFYIASLNDVVEMLLQIGQIETYGNMAIQTEKLSTLQVLQKCYSQLRGKLEVFLVENNNEEEDQILSIRSSIQKWESMIDRKSEFEVPNYSTFYTNGVSNQWKKEVVVETKVVGEIIKCTDIEDDIKTTEHVKVQNLKDIWERRGSQDVSNEVNYEVRQNGESIGSIGYITKKFEEHQERFTQNVEEEFTEQNELPKEEEHDFHIEEKFHEIFSQTIEENGLKDDEINESIEAQLIFLKEETKFSEDTKEPEKEITREESPISSTKEFLDEERKNNDLQLEDIDPQFGPPTGILPDPNKNYEQIQIVEEKIPENQFIIINEQQESHEEISGLLEGENVRQVTVLNNTHKEENYLLLDNRSVEEIQKQIKDKEEIEFIN